MGYRAPGDRKVDRVQWGWVDGEPPIGSLKQNSVLIIDDEPGIRSFLRRGMEKQFGLIEAAEDLDTAERLVERCHFDLIIAEVRLPDRSDLERVKRLRGEDRNTALIFISAHASAEAAIEALRAGAADFILKPFRMAEIMAAVERCMKYRRPDRGDPLRRQGPQTGVFDDGGMVGGCEAMARLRSVIRRIAPMPTTVLIEGESGTGKELAARAIHLWSGRGGGFVPVNCGAIAPELIESEIFGHVKGAFTGAHQAREGLFAYANDGTLFLDEISELPLPLQIHLLRVLEEQRIRPVGANREIPVDVRILAASNRNLALEVECGRFREDLYYRLNVVSVRMPALREHLEDVPELVDFFVRTLSSDMGIAPRPIEKTVLEALCVYPWPGNVRELRNVIERCLALGQSPEKCLRGGPSGEAPPPAGEDTQALSLEVVEKRHILKVLDMNDGNKSAAARQLGVSRKTLERKVQAWQSDDRISSQ